MPKKTYSSELKFQSDLINKLISSKGWSENVLRYQNEEDLIQNWKDILFRNNNGIDQLNGCPLTDTEMAQIVSKVNQARTPVEINRLVNGRSIAIRRDNPNDELHIGKEVSLRIYDRNEIAGGRSVYQIVDQPLFDKNDSKHPTRRGDVLLLICGMPLIHIELKRSNVPVNLACTQIETYSKEGKFDHGIFSMVQVFVAMTPEDTVYFANPGQDGKFNSKFYFHVGNENHEQLTDWEDVAEKLLSIPSAHMLIGFYTIADQSDGVLKVMRSYQYIAANAISNKVNETDWNSRNKRNGGYIWHTTGSGKTLSSYKAAQLVAESGKAQKVVFLVDRIELGTQSLAEYRNFAEDEKLIQETTSAMDLLKKLKSKEITDTLIVTSIQKMSDDIFDVNINPKVKKDLEKINSKRMVIIVDEAHRSTTGEMMGNIRERFTNSVFFGFTGTPIFKDENDKSSTITTADIFGPELVTPYTIGEGIRDGNVLKFTPYMVATFKDSSIKEKVALHKAKAQSVEEVLADPVKHKIYFEWLNRPMVGYYNDETQKYVKGIEDEIPDAQYQGRKHHEAVADNIIENWTNISIGNLFHAILATSSIKEALDYYDIFKEKNAPFNCTVLVDASIDATKVDAVYKEEKLYEIRSDYASRYNNTAAIDHNVFKEDLTKRLAHKKPYKGLSYKDNSQQINLVIVVNQLLTGYDSKFINAIYLDKMLVNEQVIQAISRTNRILDSRKQMGIVKYFRRPHTMKKNIEQAIGKYARVSSSAIYADKLEKNIKGLSLLYNEIIAVFNEEGIENFSRLPESDFLKGQFSKLYKELIKYYEAARIQGYSLDCFEYSVPDDAEDENSAMHSIITILNRNSFNALKMRYSELVGSAKDSKDEIPFDVDTTIVDIETDAIDAAYIDSRFKRYLKAIEQADSAEAKENILAELHKSFSSLSQSDQEVASKILYNFESGSLKLEDGKTFQDYLVKYKDEEKNDSIHNFAVENSLDERAFRSLFYELNVGSRESEIDELLKDLPIKGFEKIKLKKAIRSFIEKGVL